MFVIGLDTVLRVATVLVSVAVVSAPILYPKHSLFVRRANEGLNRLAVVREEHEEVDLAYLERGEKGFKELSEAVEVAFGSVGEMERICHAIGKPSHLGEFTGLGMEYGVGDNGVLYAEMEDNRAEILRWNPWSPATALRMEKLERGISLRARERSHFITIALAVLWATLSIVVAF